MAGDRHVIFGTGPTGAGAMRVLVNEAYPVRMINRTGKPSPSIGTPPAGVEIVAADAYDIAATERLTADAAVVYQCAQPAYHEWEAKFPQLQASILGGAIRAGARFVALENLYVYGDPDGQPLTEESPIRPHTRKGRVRAAMSLILQEAVKQGKLQELAILRASNFYGPGYEIFGEQVVLPATAGKRASGMGNLDAPHTFTYIGDVGQALVILGTCPADQVGGVWHVPSAPPITQRDLIARIITAAGTSAQIGSISKMMMRIGGLFIPTAREVIEMMYEFEKPFIMDSSKFTNAFGMNPTPIDEGVRKTVAWFKAHA